ncbi:Uncharacterised protein [Legionella beliardensis]|uniref:Uncharacterized protein n=1 Tax=Legionella beliardensis TaxID=91822 RepID=A0A378HZ43_9GAMM|nr:hypothetical protein [Legionella beliardensis]STX28189.1 Uncharacterised protein [Legionella beliardensis]
MHITLNLTKEGKIELSLETDCYQPNPKWAIDWIQKNMASIYNGSGPGFSYIEGSVTIVNGEQIKSFLDVLVSEGQNHQISTRAIDQSLYCSSFAIATVEQAKNLRASIHNFLVNKITDDDFQSLQEQTKALRPTDLSAKEQFINAHNKYCSQSIRLFGQGFSKSSYENSNLKEIVKDAINQKSSCRAVFMDLGWMKPDGSLAATAPQDVLKAYQDNIPDVEEPLRP